MSKFPLVNKHGLEAGSIRTALKRMCDNSNDYTPKEFARDMAKLSYKTDSEACMITVNTLETNKSC